MATELVWSADTNHPFAVQSPDASSAKWYLWYLVHQLLGANTGGVTFSSGLWTTYQSCDGAAYGTAGDGVDRWGASFDATKLVAATPDGPPNTQARSWYVLKSPVSGGFTSPMYLIVDMSNSDPAQPDFWLCKAAPTGGSTVARPTSTDEARLMEASSPDLDRTIAATNNTKYVSMVLSSRGDFWLYSHNQNATSFHSVLGVTQIVDKKADDVCPVFGLFIGDGFTEECFSYYPSYNSRPISLLWANPPSPNGYDPSHIRGFYGRTSDNAHPARLVPLMHASGSTGLWVATNAADSFFSGADYANGKFLELPAFVISGSPLARTQYPEFRGRLPDMKFASGALPVFSTRQSGSTLEYVKVGWFWMPWGGTRPPIR